MTQASTLVALATYNEIENLPRLVDEILRVVPDADILVVDDNSPDGTGRWCDERATSEPRLRCLHRESKLGLGSATIEAMRFAIDRGYETGDDGLRLESRSRPLAVAGATDHADVAIGSRYCPGGAIDGWPLHRRLASRLLNGLIAHHAASPGPRFQWVLSRLPGQQAARDRLEHDSSRAATPISKKFSGTSIGQAPRLPKCRLLFAIAWRANRKMDAGDCRQTSHPQPTLAEPLTSPIRHFSATQCRISLR